MGVQRVSVHVRSPKSDLLPSSLSPESLEGSGLRGPKKQEPGGSERKPMVKRLQHRSLETEAS